MGAAKETERDATKRRLTLGRSVLDELIGRKVGCETSYGRFGVIFDVKAGEITAVEVEDKVTYR